MMQSGRRREVIMSDRSARATGKRWIAMGLVVLLGAVVLAPGCYFPDDVKAFLQKDLGPVTGIEYRFYPPDSLSIRSLNVPEISGAVQRIRPDGKINLSLLGEIFVAGKTAKEIETAARATRIARLQLQLHIDQRTQAGRTTLAADERRELPRIINLP